MTTSPTRRKSPAPYCAKGSGKGSGLTDVPRGPAVVDDRQHLRGVFGDEAGADAADRQQGALVRRSDCGYLLQGRVVGDSESRLAVGGAQDARLQLLADEPV